MGPAQRVRWSLRQIYLAVFWPTQFAREVEARIPGQGALRRRATLRYMVEMLPCLLLLTAVGNVLLGLVMERLGIAYRWGPSWRSLAVTAALGVGAGVALGPAIGILSGIIVGIGVAGWVGSLGMWRLAPAGVVSGAVTGVLAGLASGAGAGTAAGLAGGALGGILLGLMMGVATGDPRPGAAFGVAFWLTYFRLVTYPFDAALSAVTYFAGRRRPHALRRIWSWCPVAWNEVAWLPLPFAGRLLGLLARQDRDEGFRQIAFVAAERPLQRRASLLALEEIAVNDLRGTSLPRLADMPQKLRWTLDAPAQLPGALTTALPRFDRAAHHVAQYLVLHNAYRKDEALGRALEEMEALQRSLIAGRGRLPPRLLQVANEWRALLEAARDALRLQAAEGREIPNPFVFGNPVAETETNVFAGRQDLVRRVEESLLGSARAPALLLHGPRRMGKTSVLNQLPRLLGPDFAPAVVDCQNPAVTGSLTTLLRYLARAVTDGLRRRRATVAPLAAEALDREPFAAFDAWLDDVERAMPERMRVLLCLDEYEHLQVTLDAGWGGPFLDALRHIIQHRPRLALLFCGAHTFAELGAVWTDRFLSVRRIRVSFLGPEEVRLLLTQPIPEFPMTFAAGALDAIFAATRGQPFLTQAVAFELVQLANQEQRREATVKDVDEAIQRALVSGGEYFANLWSDAGTEGQAVLRVLARGEPAPDLPAAGARLREHDILAATGDFAVPMVRRWVSERTS